jgi:hypothetical protein
MDQFEAARWGDLEQLRGTLTRDNVDDLDVGGWTALLSASFNGHVECAKLCIEMGANVNARSHTECTPLHFASSKEDFVDVVRILLDAGAIVDVANCDGWTPLCFAIATSLVDNARLLIDGELKCQMLSVASPAIPDWITVFIASRSNCRCVAIIIIGIHKYRRTNITGNNDINVLRLIGKHIWSARMARYGGK